MQTATDTELSVRKYSRHLQAESMLAELSKDDVIIQKAKYHNSVL